jgi:hypothetical protein
MSNNTETSCCDHCDDEYTKCIGSGGNPTQQERCEKFRKRCKDGCNGGEGC